MAIGAKLTAASDYLFRRLFKFLFRYDIFISYARRDGKGYALKLKEQLTGLDFSCFLDYDELPPGNSLNSTLRRALKRSAAVVLVGTEGALASRYVELEVAEFARTGRALIPVDFEGTLEGAPWPVIKERDLVWIDETKDALARNTPSPLVADSIDKLFKYTRRNVRVRGQVIATMLLFLLGAAASVLLIQREVRAARAANAAAQQQEVIARDATAQAKIDQGKAVEAAVGAARATAEAANAQLIAVIERTRTDEQVKIAERQTALARSKAEEARRQQQIAEERQLVANSRELASNAVSQLRSDPELSLLLSAEAERVAHTEQAEDALRQSLNESHVRVAYRGHEGPLNKAALSPDGRFVVTTSEDRSARVWDAPTGRERFKVEHGSAADDIVFSPDGRFVLTRVKGKAGVLLKELATGRDVKETGGPEYILDADFSPDGSLAVTLGFMNDTARVWETETGRGIALLHGHGGSVSLARFSPDGRHVLTAANRTARVWEARTGNLLHTLSGHNAPIFEVAFSPDGRRVLTTSHGETRVWETKPGQPSGVLRGADESTVQYAAFSPDGATVLTREHNGKEPLLWFPTGPDQYTGSALSGHEQAVNDARFSPDGKLVVTTSVDATARVWDVRTQRQTVAFQHPNMTMDASFSPDGRYVLTNCLDQVVRVWEVRTGQVLLELRGHADQVTSAEFSREGDFVLTASEDGTARRWSWEANAQRGLRELLGRHTDLVNDAAFSPDGQLAATAGSDGRAFVWEAEKGRVVELKGHKLGVRTIAFSPNGRHVVTADGDDTARVWDALTGRVIRGLGDGEHGVSHSWAAFSPDGALVATGDEDAGGGGLDPAVRVWDAATGQKLTTLRGYLNAPKANLFSPDGRLMALGARKGDAALVCDPRTGRVLFELKVPGGTPPPAPAAPPPGDEPPSRRARPRPTRTAYTVEVAFSADGRRLLTRRDDGKLRVWDARGGRLLSEPESEGRLEHARLSPDGETVAALREDGDVTVWDARTGRSLARVPKDFFGVNSVSFSPDGRLIAVADMSGRVSLFEARTARPVLEFKGHGDAAMSAVFSPDGTRLLTVISGEKAAVKIYSCETCGTASELLALARRRLGPTGREFTPQERSKYLRQP